MNEPSIWSKVTAAAASLEVRTFIDGGAYNGSVTSGLVPHFPNACFYCFEPSPANFADLQRRFKDYPRITCIPAALAADAGTQPFHVGFAPFTSSLFPRNRTGRRYYKADFEMADTVYVRTVTLDAFCAEAGLETIDILKLDTQGGEHAILEGANTLLSSQAIHIIVTEFFLVPHYEGTPLLDDIWALLRGHGYDVFDLIPGSYAQNGQLRFGDAIFVSSRFRKEHLDARPAEP